jgi:hypothetical protein
MGRKGVSKRKPAQKKGKQLSSDKASSGIFPLVQAPGTRAIKLPEQDKADIPASQGKGKQSSDSRKNPRRR